MIDFTSYREPYLQSARIVLEPLTAWHGEGLFPLLRDPMMYSYIPGEPPISGGEVMKRFERLETRLSPDETELWLNWAVRLLSAGYVGMVEATVREDGTALTAWRIFTPHQRQGLGREAVQLMLEHLKAIGVVEARAFVDTRNAASIRLAEAAGFQRIETHVMREKLRGRWIDDHEYSRIL